LRACRRITEKHGLRDKGGKRRKKDLLHRAYDVQEAALGEKPFDRQERARGWGRAKWLSNASKSIDHAKIMQGLTPHQSREGQKAKRNEGGGEAGKRNPQKKKKMCQKIKKPLKEDRTLEDRAKNPTSSRGKRLPEIVL